MSRPPLRPQDDASPARVHRGSAQETVAIRARVGGRIPVRRRVRGRFALGWSGDRGAALTIGLIQALGGLGLFLLSYIGLGISLFPYIVPRAVTIWEAAAPPQSLSFMLVGAAVLLPIILGYTGYVYWVFRGKIDPDAGYH